MSTTNTPTEVRPPRMEALARLPVFFALEGKRAVLAGGSPAAAWKAELLSATGAKVDVFAAEPSEELLAAIAEAPKGPVTLHRRGWAEADLAGAAIAIGAIEDAAEGARFAAAARARPAFRSTSWTSPRCAISPSGRSSTARRSWSAFRPTAPRRCSRKRCARGSKPCCRAASRAGSRPRATGACASSRPNSGCGRGGASGSTSRPSRSSAPISRPAKRTSPSFSAPRGGRIMRAR